MTHPAQNIKTVAIIGSGPAGLMAATVVAAAGHAVTVFEKRPSQGRKLLIAGSSGLNITYDAPQSELPSWYRGPREHFERLFEAFPPSAWLAFVEDLGVKTFLGTSRRYFIEGLKATPLLHAWIARLTALGASFETSSECTGFEVEQEGAAVLLSFRSGTETTLRRFDAAVFALGGGSYEENETPLRWPAIFTSKGLRFEPFRPSNVGFEVAWPVAFLKEAEGQPLKSITLRTAKGSQRGELMITRYGLEGTPIYRLGEPGPATLDLKPDLTEEAILARLTATRENLAPIRRVKKHLKLAPAAQALLFHCTDSPTRADLPRLVHALKNLPLQLERPRPLAEAISSAGGLSFDELTSELMLRRFPGVFAAGEMLDWDAPTGGFLIQACVSQGRLAARGLLDYVSS